MKFLKNKYKNQITFVDGIRFHSKKEARRWIILQLFERGGHIKDLKRQVEFKIEVNNTPICVYKADFTYIDQRNGQYVVEDTKGFKTPEYALKKRLLKAVHGVDLLET